MCLAVPGQVVLVGPEVPELRMGRVRFGGVSREVCLAFVPEVRVGDYVIVHAGFALTVLDEAEAERTLELLRELALPGGGDDALR